MFTTFSFHCFAFDLYRAAKLGTNSVNSNDLEKENTPKTACLYVNTCYVGKTHSYLDETHYS